eukprot:SAG31_NODE_13063_length_895_cov_1.453518_1_plen_70_part_10
MEDGDGFVDPFADEDEEEGLPNYVTASAAPDKQPQPPVATPAKRRAAPLAPTLAPQPPPVPAAAAAAAAA